MTVSITPSCKKADHGAARAARWLARRAAQWLIAVFLGLWGAAAAHANGIEVRKAALTASEEGYVLEAVFDIQLTPLLDDVLHKGVPLYFTLEFEVLRPRWYWTNEKIVSLRKQQRLSFNTLTRQYRVGAGALYQNFPTLADALAFMSRLRRREDIEPGLLRKDTSYTAELRLRLDAAQLPKPFQLNTGRDWNIGSDWYRWTVTP
jgi:Domain of unknown function (DUF4390)